MTCHVCKGIHGVLLSVWKSFYISLLGKITSATIMEKTLTILDEIIMWHNSGHGVQEVFFSLCSVEFFLNYSLDWEKRYVYFATMS